MRVRYTIGLREANHHLAKHIKAVEEGHEVIITRRGRPVARLTHELGADRTRDPEWQAAYERMLKLMAEGLPLGGSRMTRDEIYERHPSTDA
jgi:antitoxin (DNA-binding transcriptional repressor) of toxin-antitoxin stability system